MEKIKGWNERSKDGNQGQQVIGEDLHGNSLHFAESQNGPMPTIVVQARALTLIK
jgi:hypothetical protein